MELADPMSRGRSQPAPISAEDSPLTIPVALNTADSDAMRRSQPSDRHMPPPNATPLTAAMTGCGIERSRLVICE